MLNKRRTRHNLLEIGENRMISLIVAYDKNRVIGYNNSMPWYLPEDLKYFKETTMGKPMIMGRKTFESIGRPLPNRTNIIITRNKNYSVENAKVAHSLNEALQCAKEIDKNIFIIGGGKIYEQAIDFADIIEVTEVHENFEGDTYFPEIDLNVWKEISRIKHHKDEKNKFDYSFVRYERKLDSNLKSYH